MPSACCKWPRANTLLLLLVLSWSPGAAGDARQDLDRQAESLRAAMIRRGDAPGEISLSLAWLYARAGQSALTLSHIRLARKHGVGAGRIDLLLGTFYRMQARYDAAFSTLVRVLVAHPQQPYALVQLWKTLYESSLQGSEVSTDIDAIRERLAGLGLHFPAKLDAQKLSQDSSAQLAAAGYNALLTGKARFAAELFEAAIDAFPSNPLAHRGLGIARARLQDYARAAGAYLLYLELKPDAPDADGVDRVLMEYWKQRSAVSE